MFISIILLTDAKKRKYKCIGNVLLILFIFYQNSYYSNKMTIKISNRMHGLKAYFCDTNKYFV
jgi:hypothetical protein